MMVEDQIRTLTGDGIARNTSRSSLTIRGFRERHFRAHPSAAPLKLRARRRSRSPVSDFRAHPSAAPLKLSGSGGPDGE